MWHKSRSKYGNIKTEYNGVLYHSKKEAGVAQQLDLMKKDKNKGQRVKDWQGQVKYPIAVEGEHICNYIADFVVSFCDGRQEVWDVKSAGTITDVYKIKKKLLRAVYRIDIIEI